MGLFSWRKKTKRGPDQNPEEMGFFDHLEELRWHLMRSVIAIIIFAVVLFIYRIEIIGGVFMAPFRYDFVTYEFICENISSDFCPPVEKGEGAFFSLKQDSLELSGIMQLPESMFPEPAEIADTAKVWQDTVNLNDSLLQSIPRAPRDTLDSLQKWRKVPVHLRVDAKEFLRSGQVAGMQVRTKNGQMVAIQATSPYEQFMKAMIYAFFAGTILAFPYVMWEMWVFIRPALAKKEAKRVRWNVLYTSILFFFGIAFGYFIILPTSVLFLAQFVLFEEAENIWRIGDVINFELTVLFGTGLVFQLPLVVYYLSLIGMVTPKFLKKYRRHSIVILLTIAAIITPSPDPFSQLMVFTPLMILYELSIFISGRVEKRKAKEAAEEELKEKARKAEAAKAVEPEENKTEE